MFQTILCEIDKKRPFVQALDTSEISSPIDKMHRIIKSWFKHHFKKSNIHLQSVLTVDSHQAIISAIQHHVGMGIVASHIVSKEIQRGQIIGIKTSKPEIRNQISLTQLQDKIPTLTEKIFEKFLLKKIELIGLQVKRIER